MQWFYEELTYKTRSQTAHLITDFLTENLPWIKTIDLGLLNVFLQHTSASLSINENCDPDVRDDLVMSLDRIVPENMAYKHKDEGADDMPAHVKSSLLGVSLNIPIRNGALNLGRWQGIYLCEHRSMPHVRKIVCTANGVVGL